MSIKIFELRPIDVNDNGADPWSPWFDKAFGFIVAANDEKEARAFAAEEAGGEARTIRLDTAGPEDYENWVFLNPWENPAFSTCVELVRNEPGVILQDFSAA